MEKDAAYYERFNVNGTKKEEIMTCKCKSCNIYICLDCLDKLIKKAKEEEDKKIINILANSYQFSCLESWCITRKNSNGLKGHCKNCKDLNEIEQKLKGGH